MYAIMGVTGQVGHATATHLLRGGHAVRAIVREHAKGETWLEKGAEVVVADWSDAEALRAAFENVEGVFVMLPANFAPAPGLSEARALLHVLSTALSAAKPPKLVALSSVGAQHSHGLGLITQLNLLEQALDELPIPRAFVRAAWFMENLTWDIASAMNVGEFSSYLQPIDRAIPMVATDDIGRVIAQTLSETWSGRRVIEIEGPQSYAPLDMAGALGSACGRVIKTIAVPPQTWAARFAAEGTPPERSAPRIEMLEGFNSGWIDFERTNTEHVRSDTSLQTVVDSLVARWKQT
ncbi:NAD-dependent epimerase/dehydratase family protein [Pseudolysobacter antarcticus]|uniref:NAD-dependent epimerase/dehydratase family protein n=1 Tax=Pseudolysobacter antarcticus TaxID=2511995 RepID=A0A411HGF7_9GAMM|nr:NmrA family NAD(P)-binding protein [Pseudolysobacter antarcticus]QBB69527.1 NAD-dependent epimerase/dehydratase family protein [Pseudolysobacter antarcticus]